MPDTPRPSDFRRSFAPSVVFTDEEWAVVEGALRPVHLEPSEPFVREGDRRRRVGYVVRGVLHHAALREGSEHVVGFDFEGDVAGDFEGFFDGAPATNTIRAVEGTDLLVLTHDNFAALATQIPALQGIRAAVASQLFEGARARATEMQQYSAEARYRRLLDRSPRVLQRVPLYMVASYLGVTPEALSRIRRRVSLRPGDAG